MWRMVMDTNVVLSGLLWRGAPHALLVHVQQNPALALFSSPALLDELAEVLSRPSLSRQLKLINKRAVDVLADYVRAVTVLEPQPLPKPTCRDPDDDEVLALALLARAELIVSGDKDLLDMQRFEGIPLLPRPRRSSASHDVGPVV